MRVWLLILLSMIMVGCSSKDDLVLNVYNWSDYIDPEVVAEFEQIHGVRVIYDTFASNEELLAKLEAGASGYDVIFPSDYMVEIMIEEQMLSPIDKEKLVNFDKLSPNFIDPPYDPECKYSIPFTYGTSGIGFNSEEVSKDVTSWDIFWDMDYAGRILLLDDMREVFGIAYKHLGYSVNDTDPQHLEEAKTLLMEQKQALLKYESTMNKDLLLNREAVLSHYWVGDMYQVIDEDDAFDFAIPEEGAVLFTDCMAIPANAPHKDLAHKFIDHILSPVNAGRIINVIWYAMPIPDAMEYVEEEIRNDGNIFPSKEILDKCEFLTDLGEFNRAMDEAWTEIKMK